MRWQREVVLGYRMDAAQAWMKRDLKSVPRAAVPVLAALVIGLIPAPEGLTPAAWRFFAIFAGTVAALILEPIPAAAAGLISVSLAALLRLVDPSPAASARWALSGFANTTVWLIFAAFVFALGYERSGLGKRLALLLIRAFGKRPLGLGYAAALSDLLLAPFTPSNTARSAGTIFPVVRQIPPLFGHHDEDAARRIGGYLAWTCFAVTCVTSSMFLTALAPNLLAVEVVSTTLGVRVGWTEWARGFWPVAVVLVSLVPAATYVIFRPRASGEDDPRSWADAQLHSLGRFSKREATMTALALMALAGWIAGGEVADPTVVALSVVGLMLITGVVSWEDVLGHKAAWNVLAWFATLVAMADGLARVGFVAWVARGAASGLGGKSPAAAALLLLAMFFVVHYLFASITAHVAAVLPVVLAAGAAIPGIDAASFAMMLCYSLGLMGVIGPYATGPAPAYYASGYLSRRQFWLLGLAFGTAYLGALLTLAAVQL